MTPPHRWRRLKPGPSAQIIIGLLLGVAAGLFVGERAAVLAPLADVYIRLMQMTVLPYLVLTLIGGLGQLDAGMARRMGLRALGLLTLLIGVGVLVVAVMPLTFPGLEEASFYSDTLIEPRQRLALSEVYVPANPFNAMANAIVPSVVLFSAAIGLALIGVPSRTPLLDSLKALERAVVRVTRFILKLTPYGVFAITANLAGTMDLGMLQRLEVYMLAFVAASLVLAFVALPLLVSALTPFSYREVMHMGKDAMVTAFVASSAFIVLPMLVERVREALTEHAIDDGETRTAVDVVIPVAFVVPNAGKLMTLLFVPYAAWMAGTALDLADYIELIVVGVPSYFAKAQIALPYLLDLLGVPQDLFQFYIPSAIVTGKFDSMVTVVSLLALALMTAAAVAGQLRLDWKRVVQRLAAIAGVTAVTVLLTRVLLGGLVDTAYTKDDLLRDMHLSRARLPVSVHATLPEADAPVGEALRAIRERGVLRVGFVPGRVPLAFVNARGDLVGMDVELAAELGEVLGVRRLEFYPVDFRSLAAAVADGRVDLGMGMPFVPEALPVIAYSTPYLESTVGLVVRDRDRHAFSTVGGIRDRGRVRIGLTVESTDLEALLRRMLPGVDLEFVLLTSPKEFLSGAAPDIDAMAELAESGAAWSVLHPAYSVVVPQPDPVSLPVAVALRRGDRDLIDVVNAWTVIERSSGALREMRNYWILGFGAQVPQRRWSVMDDVLGWGDKPVVPTLGGG